MASSNLFVIQIYLSNLLSFFFPNRSDRLWWVCYKYFNLPVQRELSSSWIVSDSLVGFFSLYPQECKFCDQGKSFGLIIKILFCWIKPQGFSSKLQPQKNGGTAVSVVSVQSWNEIFLLYSLEIMAPATSGTVKTSFTCLCACALEKFPNELEPPLC